MYGWNELLTDTVWIGAYVTAALVALLEWRYALFRRTVGVRTPNVAFGILTLAITVTCAVLFSEPLTAVAYKLSLFSLADLPLPAPVKIVLGFMLIDFAMYANHFVSHKFGLMWRMHRTHHADPFVTGTTGLLHHPLETVWSFVFLMFVYVMFGVPVGAILIYGAATALHSILSHANLPVPNTLNAALGMIVVMPSMHRIHHSTVDVECNSNYGLILSIWDRLFGTYTAEPAGGAEQMTMGVAGMKEGDIGFVPLLQNPFKAG